MRAQSTSACPILTLSYWYAYNVMLGGHLDRRKIKESNQPSVRAWNQWWWSHSALRSWALPSDWSCLGCLSFHTTLSRLVSRWGSAAVRWKTVNGIFSQFASFYHSPLFLIHESSWTVRHVLEEPNSALAQVKYSATIRIEIHSRPVLQFLIKRTHSPRNVALQVS